MAKGIDPTLSTLQLVSNTDTWVCVVCYCHAYYWIQSIPFCVKHYLASNYNPKNQEIIYKGKTIEEMRSENRQAKQHRLYLVTANSNNQQIVGTSDSYKYGRSIPYSYCTCATGEDHEE